MNKSKTTIILMCPTCNAEFERTTRNFNKNLVYYCSKICRKPKSEGTGDNRGKFLCGTCKEWLERECFSWYEDPRYSAGVRKFPHCRPCYKVNSAEKYKIPEIKEAQRARHEAWRDKNLADCDTGLKFYFDRHLSQYRRRALRKNVPIDLDSQFMVDLFNKQEGKCFYSGIPMIWQTYGSEDVKSDFMSVDRIDPSLGYTKENVVLCLFCVNTMKLTMSVEKFVSVCKSIVETSETRQL